LLSLLQKPKDTSREAVIENQMRIGRLIGSPGYPVSEEQRRAEAIESVDRAYYPAGVARHFGAVLGSGSLRHYDRQITAPTVVIHGNADKLMRPSGGRAVARAIPGARFVSYDGMAHDLPEKLWDQVIGELRYTFDAGR
jgi:pimeloyl-ACP methyl ester carboxylesterase